MTRFPLVAAGWQNGVLVLKRAPAALLAAVTLLTCASADAGYTRADASGATARAYGIRVIVPDQPGASTPTVAAPPDYVQFSAEFDYNNGAVKSASANASVSAVSGTTATASASTEVSSLSLFGGEITASTVVAEAHTTARAGAANGDITASHVDGLVALGQPVESGSSVALADWGSLHTIEGDGGGTPETGYRGSVTALDIRLTAEHGGLPAGTTILVGYAEVAAQASPPEPLQPAKPPASNPKAKSPAPEPTPFPPIREPPNITPPLKTPGGHVFPVYGPSSFVDTYGAPRGDVSGGWHHGDDIFAPLGAPILAVASGTVFSVGWNRIGGNRLWLQDGAGNLYYYAHLSAFTPLAINGNQVNAGDVLGFVGNTGDAETTPYHLHFEIHPVGLLGLGYDGAVNPTQYLLAWKHLQDVSFDGGDAWAAGPAGTAPKPGAILLAATDISSADGLDPGSLQRAIAPIAPQRDALVTKSRPVSKTRAGRPSAARASGR